MCRGWVGAVLLAALAVTGGCQHAPVANEVAPVPLASKAETGGLLLQTGAVQLGPGVGQNAWRWQGDGKGGF